MRFHSKTLTLVLSMIFLFVWTTPVLASDDAEGIPVLVDTLVVRPLGVAATLLGTVIFVVSLPFSTPAGSVGKVAEELVLEPGWFTFKRPVGEFNEMEP